MIKQPQRRAADTHDKEAFSTSHVRFYTECHVYVSEQPSYA